MSIHGTVALLGIKIKVSNVIMWNSPKSDCISPKALA